MNRTKSRWFAAAGLFVSIVGPLYFIWESVRFPALQFPQQTGRIATLWPLPFIPLAQWALCGSLIYLSFTARASSARSRPEKSANDPNIGGRRGSTSHDVVAWLALGAMIPLAVIGLFSIGPYVMLSAILFVCAHFLDERDAPFPWLRFMAVMLIGALFSAGFLWLVLSRIYT